MKRSKCSLSHYKLLTMDMGQLIPIGMFEVLPGDTVQQATSALIRVAPMLAPVMHPVRVKIHHWYVPYRLIWADFEKFITGGPDGNDATVPPYYEPGAIAQGSLLDYLGMPVGTPDCNISALPTRAYQLIWNEFYRDEDLQTEAVMQKTSGQDTGTIATLQNVCWEKDYFTTTRPWTQKGTDISVPISPDGTPPEFSEAAGANPGLKLKTSVGQDVVKFTANGIGAGDVYWDDPKLQINLNELRESIALQRFAEMRARFGSRYSEYLRSLGVRPRDGRLERPEYLGGGRQVIQFSEVLQTAPNFDANSGVGSMKGHGIGALRSNRYRRFFDEHGLVLSLMSVLPKTMYSQGISKLWTRTMNEDYFQRELQTIGQAEVKNREVYMDHTTPDGTFGYQDRYDEYRRHESGIAGEFRTTLNHWHMAREFSADPALNSTFVSANPTKRILASTGTNGLYVMVNHSIQARRPIMGR